MKTYTRRGEAGLTNLERWRNRQFQAQNTPKPAPTPAPSGGFIALEGLKAGFFAQDASESSREGGTSSDDFLASEGLNPPQPTPPEDPLSFRKSAFCSNLIAKDTYCGRRVDPVNDIDAVELSRNKWCCGACVDGLIADSRPKGTWQEPKTPKKTNRPAWSGR